MLCVHTSRHNEQHAALRRAGELLASSRGRERVAVIVLDTLQLPTFEADAGMLQLRATVLGGRDQAYELQYSRRNIVLTAAEYVAGLQFDDVVIAGLPASSDIAGYELRRLLSLLYLGISRASRYVELHVNTGNGTVPEVLQSAVSAHVLFEDK